MARPDSESHHSLSSPKSQRHSTPLRKRNCLCYKHAQKSHMQTHFRCRIYGQDGAVILRGSDPPTVAPSQRKHVKLISVNTDYYPEEAVVLSYASVVWQRYIPSWSASLLPHPVRQTKPGCASKHTEAQETVRHHWGHKSMSWKHYMLPECILFWGQQIWF